jgi:hypothetical protein
MSSSLSILPDNGNSEAQLRCLGRDSPTGFHNDYHTRQGNHHANHRDTLVPPIAFNIPSYLILPVGDVVTISDSTAHDVAGNLIPMLKETSSFTRAIIIELLLKLYMKHRMITRHWP